MRRTALITGATGQDGSYLAELLLSKGYTVYGLTRRTPMGSSDRDEPTPSVPSSTGRSGAGRIDCLGDLSDAARLTVLVQELRPDEIYHFGAQSDAQRSFLTPAYTTDVTGLSTLRLLEAIRHADSTIRFCQASSCEVFGDAPPPQQETSPMNPRSPYAVAKLYAYHLARVYRDAYGVSCRTGILFNHESPRRDERYVSRKLARGIARILAGEQDTIVLGDLNARRDWGYAPEYVEIMWKLTQQEPPEDLVIGSGEDHTIADFVDIAFAYAGLRPERHVRTDPRYVRRVDTVTLRADASKARRLLGWSPAVSFEPLVRVMVDADLHAAGLEMRGEGVKAVRAAGFAWSVADLPDGPPAEASRTSQRQRRDHVSAEGDR